MGRSRSSMKSSFSNPSRAYTTANKGASEMLRSVAPLISSLPGLGRELTGDIAVSDLGPRDISTHPLRWHTGIKACDPGVVGWLAGFMVLICLMGFIL
jgi:hypothetical protein